MEIYSLVFMIVMVLAFFECLFMTYENIKVGDTLLTKDHYKSSRYLVFFFAMGVLFIIAAFRYRTVGIDMSRYIPRYEIIANTPWSELWSLPKRWGFEKGFIVICKLISYVPLGPQQTFTMVTSFMIISGMYIFMKKFSIAPFVSLVVYISYGYWTNSFNVVRQYLAIAILCVALKYFVENKKKMAYLLTILTITIHTSSAVFIPVFLLSKVKFTKKWMIVSLVISSIVLVIPLSLVNYLLSLTPYQWYITRSGSGESILIVLLAIYFSGFYLKREIDKIDKYSDIWFWMMSLSILFNMFALKVGLFERIMRIYLVCLLPLVADIVYCFGKSKFKKYRVLFYIVVLIAWALYFYLIIMRTPKTSSGTIPYVPFFCR